MLLCDQYFYFQITNQIPKRIIYFFTYIFTLQPNDGNENYKNFNFSLHFYIFHSHFPLTPFPPTSLKQNKTYNVSINVRKLRSTHGRDVKRPESCKAGSAGQMAGRDQLAPLGQKETVRPRSWSRFRNSGPTRVLGGPDPGRSGYF